MHEAHRERERAREREVERERNIHTHFTLERNSSRWLLYYSGNIHYVKEQQSLLARLLCMVPHCGCAKSIYGLY